MIAVVGAGIMGLATAWALARRGREVAVYEQFEPGHRRGSSHGSSRIFRLSYPDEDWVALAQEALGLWRELERETRTELLVFTGLVDAVRDVEARSQALRARGVAHELVGAAQLRDRFGLAYTGDERALFQPDAGIARADDARRALQAALAARGVTVRSGARVERLEPDGEAVTLVLADGDLRAEVTVVTAGGWVDRLVGPLGLDVPVTVTRETVAYFPVPGGWARPSVIDDLDDHRAGESFYALLAPGVGLKAGAHRAGPPADPDEERPPDRRLVDAVGAWVARRFPDAGREPVAAETCLYTNAPGERFLLERHGRVVLGSACSGHAFKFAPAVGERLAALAAGAGAPSS